MVSYFVLGSYRRVPNNLKRKEVYLVHGSGGWQSKIRGALSGGSPLPRVPGASHVPCVPGGSRVPHVPWASGVPRVPGGSRVPCVLCGSCVLHLDVVEWKGE